jgi:hypothetical protein
MLEAERNGAQERLAAAQSREQAAQEVRVLFAIQAIAAGCGRKGVGRQVLCPAQDPGVLGIPCIAAPHTDNMSGLALWHSPVLQQLRTHMRC